MKTSATVCVARHAGARGVERRRGARTAATKPAGPPPPADPNAPAIAPPAPTASPQKVEEAKSTAKTAKLTPIVPSPQRSPQSRPFSSTPRSICPCLESGSSSRTRACSVRRPRSARRSATPPRSMRSIARPPGTGARAGKQRRTTVFTPSPPGRRRCSSSTRGLIRLSTTWSSSPRQPSPRRPSPPS